MVFEMFSSHTLEEFETSHDEAVEKRLARSEQHRKEDAELHAAQMSMLQTENDDLVNDIQDIVEDLKITIEAVALREEENIKLVKERDAIAEKFHDIRQGLMTEEEVQDAISLAKAEEKCRTRAAVQMLQAENEQMQQEIERLRNGQPILSNERAQQKSHIPPTAPRFLHIRPMSLRRLSETTQLKGWIGSAVDCLAPKEDTDTKSASHMERHAVSEPSDPFIVDFPHAENQKTHNNNNVENSLEVPQTRVYQVETDPIHVCSAPCILVVDFPRGGGQRTGSNNYVENWWPRRSSLGAPQTSIRQFFSQN